MNYSKTETYYQFAKERQSKSIIHDMIKIHKREGHIAYLPGFTGIPWWIYQGMCNNIPKSMAQTHGKLLIESMQKRLRLIGRIGVLAPFE